MGLRVKKISKAGTYIDLFSGCGGFSLGLGNAGWQGLFAVEKDPMAFETFRHNLIDGRYKHFDWPKWLPKEPMTIQELLRKYKKQLKDLGGSGVDLIAGGPPCQGFSTAGRRQSDDPRNKLSREYIKVVDIVRPKFLVLENVRGFNAGFSKDPRASKQRPYSLLVKEALEDLHYNVFPGYVHSEQYGVPQSRTRFLMIGVRTDITLKDDPHNILHDFQSEFLERKGLPRTAITVKHAIGDLEIEKAGAKLVDYPGQDAGFKMLLYKQRRPLNKYQALMRAGLNGCQPSSMRLPRHRPETIKKFKLIRSIARPGISLNSAERDHVGTRKLSVSVLNEGLPSKTLTTLPDDLLHYSEPRILTVREYARIQSFPDDFEFKGKYTTGGKQRVKECPRYTQVGNAVPPLLGEAIGHVIGALNKVISN